MSTEEHHHDVITQVTEQFAEVYSGSSQGIYIFLDDHHYSQNNRLLGLLGYASTDEKLADGKSFLEKLIEPQSQAKLVEAYQAAMQQMTGSTLSVSWLKKSGQILKTTVILVPISFDKHLMALHFIEVEKGQ